ncbi:hypothetical protein E4T52_06704 [Aureobasidium sp. EXF-3400]|nr:hypothetical protein E4T51_05902 [Aureobasidium sp. EXF-12344]KAI4778377.1 hypothetical protein E4T52_06704 [Aureobasidium sp. EXF-3400]
MSFYTADYAAGQPSILENMTFGCEFELLAYAPRKVDPRDHFTKALKKPVSLLCSHCDQDHSWQLPVDAALNSHGFVSAFSTWAIHRDPTVHPTDDEKAHIPKHSSFYNLELVSRVLNFCKPTPDPIGQTYPCTGGLFMWDSQIEISAFIQRIHEAFSGDGYCVATNSNTGLHIHFSNGKNPPPVKTSLGMVGVFACLERHFDRLFPASRICISPFNGPISGIRRSNSVYKYVQGNKQSDWVGAHSRPFLETIRSSVKQAIKDDPEDNRAFITENLQKSTPKAWLDIISGCDEVEDLLNSWPIRDSIGDNGNYRSMAINLQNLVNGMSKSTVEVRAAPGSLDFSEIWAWAEFMGKVMLWLSTPDIDHSAFILDIWANPNSTIMDLIKQIGVSQSTVDYYVDRLSADWAVRRHARLTSNINETDPFNSFLHAVECNRLNDYRIEAVNSKISEKLEGGHYGQISDALWQTLPADIQNHPDNFLNKDNCDYERFTDKVIADAAVVIVSPVSTRDPRSAYYQPAWSPESFNAYVSSGFDDPFTDTTDSSTPEGTSRYPRALRVTDHSDDLSDDGTDDFPFRNTDDNKTFAVPAPPGGFPDTRPESPEYS